MNLRPLHLMYGGTFDPFHDGHLSIAREAARKCEAQVHVTPAADPPHRDATSATAQRRAEMVALAIAGDADLHLDLRELQRDGPSFTVDTLLEIRDELGPRAPLAILVGADSFLSLPTWSRWERILELAHIVVADRPGKSLEGNALLREFATSNSKDLHESPHGRIYRLKQREHPASATAIRASIAEGNAHWEEWVAPPVAQFIRRNHLYGYAPAAGDLNLN